MFALRCNDQILHLFGWDAKFAPSFIEFTQKHFPVENHYFIVYGAIPEGALPCSQHVTQYQSLLKNLLPLLSQMRSARKVILHGLFSSHMYYALALHPWVLKKCYWVIWGGDLYIHNAEKKDWRHRKNEWFRRFVISRFGHFVTYLKGDYELAQQWYGARGEYHECLMYLSNVVDSKIFEVVKEENELHTGFHIMVGNSGDPSNNHIDIFEKLLPYKEQDIKIFVPLSYGDQDNARQVICQGKKWFGDKFIPLTCFMVLDQYLCFLKSIDVAIFNHKRQQAMGNTITLLGMGKKVHLRSDVTPKRLFNELGVSTFCIESINTDSLDKKIADRNSDIVRQFFTESALVTQYQRIFN